MLITFYLWEKGFLENRIVFVILLQEASKTYYEKLEGYHDGNVNEWIDFFLDGVIEIANEAISIVGEITILREKRYG